MKLIDRDLLLSEIEKSREKNPHNDSKIRANHTIEHDHIAHLVLGQPIAYDVNKVVERLEEKREKHRTDAHVQMYKHKNEDWAQYLDGMQCGIRDSIEIVKSGGIE